MSDLTEWLLACITEDESAAHYALSRDDGGALDYAGQWYGAIKHAERWEPAHVLAVCKAHREIVERHSQCDDVSFGDAWTCPDFRAIATIYASRPGWREEWAS